MSIQYFPSFRLTPEEAGFSGKVNYADAFSKGLKQGYEPRNHSEDLLTKMLKNKLLGIESKYAEPKSMADLLRMNLANQFASGSMADRLQALSLANEGTGLSNQYARESMPDKLLSNQLANQSAGLSVQKQRLLQNLYNASPEAALGGDVAQTLGLMSARDRMQAEAESQNDNRPQYAKNMELSLNLPQEPEGAVQVGPDEEISEEEYRKQTGQRVQPIIPNEIVEVARKEKEKEEKKEERKNLTGNFISKKGAANDKLLAEAVKDIDRKINLYGPNSLQVKQARSRANAIADSVSNERSKEGYLDAILPMTSPIKKSITNTKQENIDLINQKLSGKQAKGTLLEEADKYADKQSNLYGYSSPEATRARKYANSIAESKNKQGSVGPHLKAINDLQAIKETYGENSNEYKTQKGIVDAFKKSQEFVPNTKEVITQNQNVVNGVAETAAAFDKLIKLPSPFENIGNKVLKADQIAAHKAAVVEALEGIIKSNNWIRTNKSIAAAREIAERGELESDKAYRERLKISKQQAIEKAKKSREILRNGTPIDADKESEEYFNPEKYDLPKNTIPMLMNGKLFFIPKEKSEEMLKKGFKYG